ncbi:hypothetical protein ACJZ2D_008649 [Fusarium nematophilum]
MKWFIEQSKATPKHGTELNACVLYPEKEKATELPDEPPAGSKLVFVVTNVAIANTFAADFSVDLDKPLNAAEAKMTDIPTPRSISLCIIPRWQLNEDECAFSVPIELYFNSLLGWTDPALTPRLKRHFETRYKDMLPFSVGMFPIGFDLHNDEANPKTMSDKALARFTQIREKWDPDGLFPMYKSYVVTRDKMNKLQQRQAYPLRVSS